MNMNSLLLPAFSHELPLECYSAKQLARENGLHVRTLERRFGQQLKIPPKRWLIQRRLARGYALLLRGLSNKEIAGKLGCSQVSNFCRDFKRNFGCSPQDLARRIAPCGFVTSRDKGLSCFDKELSRFDKASQLRVCRKQLTFSQVETATSNNTALELIN